MVEITKLIEEGIATSNKAVQDKVVAKLVSEEIDRRAELVIKGLAKIDELSKKIATYKPEPPMLYENGKPAHDPVWNPQKFSERRKLIEKKENVEKVVNKALSEKPDFEQLASILKNDKNEQNSEKVSGNSV